MERGRLRVYLGAAPGVGKTFAMLDEGHRRSERGTDVVIGLVETHDRPKTAERMGDLEVIPRRHVDHAGLSTTELDVEAVLRRRPEVVLVDELAHANAGDPGPGRHRKRWQDVEQLLSAGIDVITTVNVQHLESLNDVVASITGVRQTEIVPDRVVRAADAVELVDMSPQALRRRMAHGNVYPAHKVDAALANYFREGNLAALRELALLWLAERVDEGLETYRASHGIAATWATRERVIVGLSAGQESESLMRRAARIASRTAGGEWLAVYIARRDGLRSVPADQLERLRQTAEDLGGRFRAVVASDVTAGLLDVARGENATQILIGASRRSRLSAVLRPGIGETVIAESGDIDVHVVTHQSARNRAQRRQPNGVGSVRRIWGYLLAVLGTALVAVLLTLTRELHGLPTETLMMLLLVIAVALVGGLLPALLAAVLASLALNFFFVPPTGTLTVADPENAFAILAFLLIASAVATVVDRAARRTEQAVKARSEANALAVLSHNLLRVGDDPDDLLREACAVFDMTGAAVLRTSPDTPGGIVIEAGHGEVPATPSDAAVTTQIEPGVTLALRGRSLQADQQSLLTAYAAHLAVLRDRRRGAEASRLAADLAEGNRTRTALLAAVSHDLRSPLAAAKAAASSLRNTEITWSKDDERELLATVEEAIDRLEGLVANLLDLSRLQTGAITPLLTELDLASAVDWTLRSIDGTEQVSTALGPDLPPVVADPGLLDRAVANIVENAIKHTPAGTKIRLNAAAWTDRAGQSWVSLRVVDSGSGVNDDRKETIFGAFQRLGDVPNGDGLGLGLAVARGLTEAMGGQLTAEDTPGGGLTLVLDLPAGTAPTATLPETGPRSDPEPVVDDDDERP